MGYILGLYVACRDRIQAQSEGLRILACENCGAWMSWICMEQSKLLKGGYIGDCIGEYVGVMKGDTRSLSS